MLGSPRKKPVTGCKRFETGVQVHLLAEQYHAIKTEWKFMCYNGQVKSRSYWELVARLEIDFQGYFPFVKKQTKKTHQNYV